MNEEKFKESRIWKYINFCCDETNRDKVPKYVHLQCLELKEMILNDETVVVNYKKLGVINKILKLLYLPENLKQSMYVIIDDWGYLALFSCLCMENIEGNMLFQKAVFEIARKNHKTALVAIIFICAMIFDNCMTRYFSVAPTGALSNEVKVAIAKFINSSPALRNEFKITRDWIKFKEKENTLYPLAYSNSSLDGRLTSLFLVDETALLDNPYPIEAMFSSQVELTSKLGILISTKYPRMNNPFEEEVSYCKRLLDEKNGSTRRERVFCLLYEPDEELKSYWNKMDTPEQLSIIYQSNPNSIKNPKLVETIKDKIALAKLYASRVQNVLLKHLNIPYQSLGAEAYVDRTLIEKAFIDNEDIDFTNKLVTIGIDLGEKYDNSATCISYVENGNVYSKVFTYIAEDMIEEKTRIEKVDYQKMIDEGHCIPCGDETTDFGMILEHLKQFVDDNNCRVISLNYDRRDASQIMYGAERLGWTTIEIPQHSSVLSAPLKILRKLIQDGRYKFCDYPYIIENFVNAKKMTDNNLNIYVSKKHSNGKVDIVFATIDALTTMIEEIEATYYNDEFIDDIYY